MTTRRRWLVMSSAAAALPLAACSAAPVQGFATLTDARKAVDALASGAWRATGSFDLPQTLHHAAQSVEFSLRGFPEMKSSVFRATVGSAAFAVFNARGAMSHSLAEPIPGAPALAPGQALDVAIARLQIALSDFEAHNGPLAPHFAYGALDKPQYTRAHLMHLANHWQELQPLQRT